MAQGARREGRLTLTSAFALAAVAVAVVLAASAAPALAFEGWPHDNATSFSACTPGCHGGHPGPGASDAVCTSCHPGFVSVPGRACWMCHEPGQDTSGLATATACTGTCHLVAPVDPTDPCETCHRSDYWQSFTHGPAPHAGIGSTPCTTCHGTSRSATDPGSSPHHNGESSGVDCTTCHNGVQASLKVNHDGITDCETCHDGMDIPAVPATCNQCHTATQFGTGTCTSASCHGTAVIHTATPGATGDCASCHADKSTGHFESLGTCATCHTDVAGYHHGGTETTALADCQGCHDGAIASAKVSHDGVTDCQSCHTGMDTPSVPAACNRCHTATAFGTGGCTSSTCHGTGVIHNATPSAQGICTDCHTDKASGHFEGLAVCETCHTEVAGYHHTGAQAIPLSECASCHDDTIASAKVNHDGITDCATCHSGMALPAVPQACVTCHDSQQYGTGSCTAAGCHSTAVIHNATPSAVTVCTDCHTGKATGHFEQYGTCATCHTDVPGYHHGGVQALALSDCGACHDGTVADAPAGHVGRSAVCSSCHTSMDVPAAGDCLGCHQAQQGPWAAVVFSNDLECADAGCHGRIANHVGTRITEASCADCHTGKASGHFEGLGTCESCHADVAGYHHGTARAVPLVDCAGCHDGSIATAKAEHAGVVDCATCHDGMGIPSVPATCSACHTTEQFGAGACTASSCHGTSVIHSATPGADASCTACHSDKASGHFEGLAACATCHTDVAGYHHAGAEAVPLSECATCHEGSIASAKASHDGITACTLCHKGMDRPVQAVVCRQCHFRGSKVTLPMCTTCHSGSGMFGREQIHAAEPSAGKTCTSCHTAHYAELGACGTCHPQADKTHHGLTTVADSELTLAADSPALTSGGSTTVRGTLTEGGAPAAGEAVTLQARVTGAAGFTTLASLTTASDGSFTHSVTPTAGTSYRAVWIGLGTADGIIRPAAASTAVEVRPLVTLRLANAASRAGNYLRYPLGRRVTASGEVRPNHALLGDGVTKGAITAVAQKHRYSQTLKKWVWTTVARAQRALDSSSRYGWAWKPRARGEYRVRASFAADADHLPAASSFRYLRVY